MNKENNKLLAEFMEMKIINFKGIEYVENTGSLTANTVDDLESFTYDWNWLMQVVEKIESINHSDFIIEYTSVMMPNVFGTKQFIAKTKIEAVYNACVEFVKWWNENNRKIEQKRNSQRIFN